MVSKAKSRTSGIDDGFAFGSLGRGGGLALVALLGILVASLDFFVALVIVTESECSLLEGRKDSRRRGGHQRHQVGETLIQNAIDVGFFRPDLTQMIPCVLLKPSEHH